MLRDLWINLSQSLLVILAIAIGIFGTGFVLDAYSILNREIDANYKMADPVSATIWMDKVDEDALSVARNYPGVASADKTASVVRARVETAPGEWDILQLYVIDDFNNIKINKIFPVSGNWPPGDDQILIERASMPIVNCLQGKTINVQVLGGPERDIMVSGVIYDPSQDPAWVNNIACGYITPGALKYLGGKTPPAGLRISAGYGNLDRTRITDTADKLGAALQHKGYQIKRVEVPIPGKYPQTDKINSLLLTLVLFGFLCLLLSAFLTAALISSLLSRQVRQIGMMKALGAGTLQIAGIYTGNILILSLIAMAIGIPLGISAGQGFAISTMNLLNFNIANSAVPAWAIVIQAAVGILIPLITALYPVYKGSRITVREAISDYGVNLKDFGVSRFDKLLERIRFLPRIVALSLRNTFRRRGRLILALIMLALGGASFISSIGASASWNQTIDNAFKNIYYDIDVRLGGNYSTDALEKSVLEVPEVTGAEAWGYAMSASFPKYSDGTYGSAYVIFAPKNDTKMINPPMIEGRWLTDSDTNAMVVDTDFMDNAVKQGTPVKVGDYVTFNLSGNDTIWHVVGVMDKIGFQSAAYVNYNYFSSITGQQGKGACLRVMVQGHDKDLQKTVAIKLEQKLKSDGFSVFIIQDLSLTRQVMVNHVILILSLLLFMSVLVAAIGALGLASTIGINVMERTREIGILRSVGASSGDLKRAVIGEGVITAVLSWILAILVSIPLTGLIAANTGQFVFPRVMQIVYPYWAPILWLGIVLIIALMAGIYPARKASRLTIREVLAYE